MIRKCIAVRTLAALVACWTIAGTAWAEELTRIDAGACSADDASIKAHPLLYPRTSKDAGTRGVVVAELVLTAEAPPAAAPAGGDAGRADYRVGDLHIVKSARNRDLDRAVLQAVGSWSFTCPPGAAGSPPRVRVEVTLDPALTPMAAPPPRPVVSAFPGWLMTMLTSSPLATVARDDGMLDGADTAALRARIEADPTFKKDGIRKPFDMYARWDDQAKQSEIWWFLKQSEGRADAVVLIKDSYGQGRRDYAARCTSDKAACAAFERWLTSNMATWYPMAEWN